jgi:hypothetical protein
MITTWGRTEEAHIGLLNTKLRQEMYNKTFWSRFAGFSEISGEGANRSVIPSGQPIEIYKDFVPEGMDNMLVPMLRNLTGAGIYGDKQLEGNEETQDLYYHKVYINQVRNGIRSGGRVSDLRVKKLQLEREKEPQLSNWLAEWNEWALAYAIYHGFSPHIMATTVNGGFYIGSGQKVPHPNFFCANSGQVTFSATDATYEGSIATALTNLTNTATDHFSVGLVEAMRVEVQKLKMKPMVLENGFEFFPWLIHPNQGRQLRTDTDWKGAHQNAYTTSGIDPKKNPIFSGAIGHLGGFVFFERLLGVFGAYPSGAGGTVLFGATNPLSALDTYDVKCSVIMGRGMIARGVAQDPTFLREMRDFENIKAIGGGMIVGDARTDFVDSTSSKTAVINQTSCVVASYSGNSFA